MNEKITDVLNILDKEDKPSQREIAKKTGFSLGLVNILIKKCAKKGLVKIERLNSRNIKYILTPQGIKEQTKRTISYVKKSYQAIQQIQGKVKEIAEKHKKQGKDIWLLKEEDDEVFELVINTLNKIKVDFRIVKSLTEIKEAEKNSNIVLYHWNPDL